MNAAVTSKEEILKTSRELIRQQGWSTVSIRAVAAACGVSVGSIYNYFDSKAVLLSETVGSVWQEIFHRPDDADVFQDVQTCVTWMYTRIAYGCEQYPGLFHPALHRLPSRRAARRQAAHAADVGAYSGGAVRGAQARREDPAGRLYGHLHRGAVCGCALFADALGHAAA